MNKLPAMLVAGVFAAVAAGTIAQTAPAEKSAAETARENAKATQSSDKAKAFSEKQKAAENLSRNSPNSAAPITSASRRRSAWRNTSAWNRVQSRYWGYSSTLRARSSSTSTRTFGKPRAGGAIPW